MSSSTFLSLAGPNRIELSRHSVPNLPSMPSTVNGQSTSSRFELPALNLDFGSITDGTNIPPPPDSPVEKKVPTPPQTPPAKTPVKEEVKETTKTQDAKAAESIATANGNLAGTKRPADDIPPSPTASPRPGSLRRLLSRTMLNNSYAEAPQSNGTAGTAGTAASVTGPASRPISRSGGSVMDERKSKRSSGWFRRLTGDNSNKRSSVMYEQPSAPTTTRPSGPPPPMIPELKELEKEETGFGSDLFKNIK